MKLTLLIEAAGAEVLTPGASLDLEIESICASDRISDLLNQASEHTLVATNLAGPQVLRVAELMGVPALCFLNGARPEREMLEKVREYGCGTVLLVSRDGMTETCRRLNECLAQDKART